MVTTASKLFLGGGRRRAARRVDLRLGHRRRADRRDALRPPRRRRASSPATPSSRWPRSSWRRSARPPPSSATPTPRPRPRSPGSTRPRRSPCRPRRATWPVLGAPRRGRGPRRRSSPRLCCSSSALLGVLLVILEWMVHGVVRARHRRPRRSTGRSATASCSRSRSRWPAPWPSSCSSCRISRVLLTLDRNASSAIAIVIGSLILAAASSSPTGPKLSKDAIAVLLALGAVVLIGAGIASAPRRAPPLRAPRGRARRRGRGWRARRSARHDRTVRDGVMKGSTRVSRGLRKPLRAGAIGLGTVLLLAACGDEKQDVFTPEGSGPRTINTLQVPVFLVAGVVGVLVAVGMAWRDRLRHQAPQERRRRPGAARGQLQARDHLDDRSRPSCSPSSPSSPSARCCASTTTTPRPPSSTASRSPSTASSGGGAYEYELGDGDDEPEIITANDLVIPAGQCHHRQHRVARRHPLLLDPRAQRHPRRRARPHPHAGVRGRRARRVRRPVQGVLRPVARQHEGQGRRPVDARVPDLARAAAGDRRDARRGRRRLRGPSRCSSPAAPAATRSTASRTPTATRSWSRATPPSCPATRRTSPT